MIKFICEKDQSPLLQDVETNQFFIDGPGRLCQKINNYKFVIIADAEGSPVCVVIDIDEDYTIKEILPEVTKIEF